MLWRKEFNLAKRKSAFVLGRQSDLGWELATPERPNSVVQGGALGRQDQLSWTLRQNTWAINDPISHSHVMEPL